MLFNSVFTIFRDFNIQCRVCYTACSVNRCETVSLFKFPIKSLMIPFELNCFPYNNIYIICYRYTAADGDTEEGLQEPDRDTAHLRDDNHHVRTSSHVLTRTQKVQ